MSVRTRVLEALLQSIAGDAATYGALDLTQDGAAAHVLRRCDVQCATEPIIAEVYGLVVCEVKSLERAERYIDPDGSIVVFVPRHHKAQLGDHPLVGRVRCAEGEWRLIKPAQTKTVEHDPPSVSLVVAVQDQAPELARLCTCLAGLDSDPHWELVVVDRGSFDATGELLRHVSGDLTSFRTPRTIDPAQALYLGLMRARGEIVAILDADLVPDPGLIRALCHGASRRPTSDVFAGRVLDEAGCTAVESGGPVRLLAMRRRILVGDRSRSAAHLAVRLRTARSARLPDFCARRLPLPIGLTPEAIEHAAQAQAHAVLAERSQRIE